MDSDTVSIDITMDCIKGETWPTESFKSFIDASGELTEDSVSLICPAGHQFTLRQALSKGILSAEQVQKVMESARKHKEEWMRDLHVHRPSDYIPSKDIEAQKLPCARCGKPAQRRLRERVLCLQCHADFDNYQEKYAQEAKGVLYNSWGKPHDLLWEKIYGRFVENLPALSEEEMKDLLEQCRKETRKVSKKIKRL